MLRTVVGIDPSGGRLALVAHGAGLARSGPPFVVELRSDREPGRFEEGEAALREYVVKHGLTGSAAFLCIPAAQVYTARIAFPPLRDRDMRAALEIELERLFPLPASRLAFGWRRSGKGRRGEGVPLVVAAAPAAYIERWQEAAARAGLTLTGAVPSAWALASALSAVGGVPHGGPVAILRDAGGEVECALLAGEEPFFSASRAASGASVVDEGLQAVSSGLSDAPGDLPTDGLLLYAPLSWWDRIRAEGAGVAGLPVRAADNFEKRAAAALAAFQDREGGGSVFDILGAYGAAVNAETIDLLGRGGNAAGGRGARWLAAGMGVLAATLAIAWPFVAAWKTHGMAVGLERELSALRPAVADVESSMADLADVEDRIATLRRGEENRRDTLFVLRDLTERLPAGTWLTGLRMERRNVEIDGLSRAANELFPPLTRDGRFRKVEFAAPITRQQDNLERFQIRAEYVPPQEPRGGSR